MGENAVRLRSWERAATEALQPPFVLTVMFLLSPAIQARTAAAMVYGLVPALLVCLGPLAVVVALAKRGRLSGHHVDNRKQRAPVMAATFVLAVLAVLILHAVHAPGSLIAFVLAVMVGMVTMLLVSPLWKISGHAMTLAGSLAALTMMVGWPVLLAGILLPIVGIARVRLRAHTAGQVIAGSCAGVVLMGGAYFVLGG
jgi:membrane-associated phospholipid phosphatase